MAPTLTSNSFLLTVTPPIRLNNHTPRLTVISTKKAAATTITAKAAPGEGNSSPFSFDFSKLGDVKSLVPAVSNPASGLSFGRRKDPSTVFVAGAMGQAGIRIAQTLLRQGFSVRAGVPDLAAAQELASLAAKYKIISNEESKKLNAVNSTFSEVESIAKAIGNAAKVVVTIGPAENGPSEEVTIPDGLQVIRAAQLANVSHVVIVYDGTSAISSTYNVLDGITTFFSNLFSRSQPLTVTDFLQKVVETDLGYTLIRTRLTDDYSPERSYNVVVSAEGSSSVDSDYKVTKSQIASLVADVFSNVEVADNKVVRVFTNPSAPSKSISEVLRDIPEDKRRQLYTEGLAKAKAEEEAAKASEQAREEAESSKKQEEAKKPEKEDDWAAKLAAEAQKKVEEAAVNNFFNKAKVATSGFSWESLSAQLKSAIQKSEEEEEEDEPKVRVATARGQARARTLPSQKAVVKTQARQPPQPKQRIAPKLKAKPPPAEVKKETRKVFGGLFKQETIYIDDD